MRERIQAKKANGTFGRIFPSNKLKYRMLQRIEELLIVFNTFSDVYVH